MVACYDGPAGTAEIGSCKSGLRACSAEGPCLGQITPQPDLCTTLADDDCNGAAKPCLDVPAWGETIGEAPSGSMLALEVDGGGNVIVLLAIHAVDPDADSPLRTVLVKLDPFGKTIFSKDIPGNGPLARAALAPDGEIIVVGQAKGDLFVDRFDGAGNLVIARTFPHVSGSPGAVATDASGNIFIAGRTFAPAYFGAEPLAPPGSFSGLFTVKLSGDGTFLWGRWGLVEPDDPALAEVTGLASDGGGNVIVAGHFTAALDLGSGMLGSAGSEDIFVAKLDAAGDVLFARRFGDAESQAQPRVAVDAADDVLLTGVYRGSLDLGGGALTASGPLGHGFLAKLDASGNHLFSRSFAAGGTESRCAVTAGPGGEILVAGRFTGTADFGGAQLKSSGDFDADIYVAAFGPTGDPHWAKSFGGEEDQAARFVRSDSAGVPVIGGELTGSLDLGQGSALFTEAEAVFVARLKLP